ncbi:hypothetical protein FM104_07250 [Microbacterium esteraromaticum]|uniref:Uncharacterized protein n=1 Tax=Microbacterium esteraromaticum TaxID=57043 RepID=A0A1R4JG61_9MICO|nr:hypothetical protein [Microbacterium esteraromaticum]SJN31070.1 hypothetical protein FM104_07250 [Microbacterium esteraromaticum]
MEWEHLFDDLEGQLAAEWDAERAALDAESERLRISKLSLHERLRSMAGDQSRLLLELTGGERWDASMQTIGADWIGVCAGDDRRLRLIPVTAIESAAVDHGTLLSSVADTRVEPGLRARMSFGFILRDLARRRGPVTIGTRGADPVQGTIDRAGADHLDLALHDLSEPRRTRSVRGFRMIPFTAIAWVRIEGGASTAL